MQQKQINNNEQVIVFAPLMTMHQFAELTGVTYDTVVGWRRRGHVPVVEIGTRALVNIAALTTEVLGHDESIRRMAFEALQDNAVSIPKPKQCQRIDTTDSPLKA